MHGGILRAGALTALTFLAGACSSTEAGAKIYRDSGCIRCHGDNRQGTGFGPPLQGLSSSWTRDQLVQYLNDPRAFIESTPRLKELSTRYSVTMPGFAYLDEKKRSDLAFFLLSR